MAHAPTAALSGRHKAVRQAISAHGLEALVVTSLPNILYLTNFTGGSATVVLTAEQLFFITDFRYVTAVVSSADGPCACPGMELIKVEGSYDATLAALLGSLPMRRVGFEAANLTVNRFQWLTRTLPGGAHSGPEFVATDGLVERLRVIKDAYEIATLREAARRLSMVAAHVPAEVRAGRTERDVAKAIDLRMHDAGFSKPAFDTIVAGGPNSALPHARPGERRFVEGDLVVLDFGGVYDSYCVDLTRTVAVGRASARAREIYQAVRDAHSEAIAVVRPGRSRFEIDEAARGALGKRGLAEAFGHGTGHGLGIEVHEDPRITRARAGETVDAGASPDSVAVAAGMVFTIEPGAYIPDWGGVRIEDDVLVTEEGVEVLTDVTTDLIET
ncbi:MAG TPA: Xaa-Pro peptidase family protein [Vicinamibacterales bacterium]|jgi:Xaa-Pro aminopeptidase